MKLKNYLGKKNKIGSWLGEKASVAMGLETTASVTSKSAKGNRADELEFRKSDLMKIAKEGMLYT